MKIIDVTLRDGGFVNDFNWDLEKAKHHVGVMERAGVHIVELGYWMQTEKSHNPFYNMTNKIFDFLTESKTHSMKAAVMIDYSYCSKNILDYPKAFETKLELIRITSRKEDFDEALKFANKLKNETGVSISFQIINCTNYTKNQLINIAEKIVETNIEIVAFADSHGNLNLLNDMKKYQPAIDIIRSSGKQWGFHLHNHTGRANMNYWLLKNSGCDYMDGSINGLGKGGGNLHLEEIVTNENLPEIMNYMVFQAPIEMRISKENAYNIICGRANVTDNYRKMGVKNSVDFYKFQSIVDKLNGVDKDSYNPESFTTIHGSVSAR